MSAITLLRSHRGSAAFIAIPAYNAVSPLTLFSLFEATRTLDAELAVLAYCCHVDDARNMLVRQFLDSQASDLVFIDADLGFEPGALRQLLSHDADIVAGSYPQKKVELSYPLRWLPGPIEKDERGLIEVKAAPTGFMRIRRRVFEALEPHQQKFWARREDTAPTAIFFERGFHEGKRCGGDYYFCKKAREAGFRIYVDPELWFEHGPASGTLGAWLRKREGDFGYALDVIRTAADDDAITRACREVAYLWANRYQMPPEGLIAVARMVEGKRSVLELGSGVSTLIMAARNPGAEIHALEDSPEWAIRVRMAAKRYGLTNVVVHDAPLVDGPHGRWYRIPAGLPQKFDFVLSDGPAFRQPDGRDGSIRHRVRDYLGSRIEQAVILFDNADRQDAFYERWPNAINLGRIAVVAPHLARAAA